MLKQQPRLFWIGLLLYVVSFFLVAISTDSDPAPGYAWAGAALVFPLAFNLDALEHGRAFANMPFIYSAVVVSGLINVVFISATVAGLIGRKHTFSTLRAISIFMIPFCWIVFARFAFLPREGHVLWIVGMLMALWSCR